MNRHSRNIESEWSINLDKNIISKTFYVKILFM